MIPAQTGKRTMKMNTSIESILSVDHWPPKRKDMQLIIDVDYFYFFDYFNNVIYFDYFDNLNYLNNFNNFDYFNYLNYFIYFK